MKLMVVFAIMRTRLIAKDVLQLRMKGKWRSLAWIRIGPYEIFDLKRQACFYCCLHVRYAAQGVHVINGDT